MTKLDLTGSGVLALAGVAVAGVVVWKIVQSLPSMDEAQQAIKDAAGKALDAVNPTNPDNVFAAGANAATRAVTGRPEDTFGGALRTATSNDDDRVAAMLRGDPIPPARSVFNPFTWFN